jgi:hypothetical protein
VCVDDVCVGGGLTCAYWVGCGVGYWVCWLKRHLERGNAGMVVCGGGGGLAYAHVC